MSAKPSRRKPSKYPFAGRLDLWFAVEQMIGRGDLAVCGTELIWFHDRADAVTQELGQLLREWKVELTRQVTKAAAAKARVAQGGV